MKNDTDESKGKGKISIDWNWVLDNVEDFFEERLCPVIETLWYLAWFAVGVKVLYVLLVRL